MDSRKVRVSKIKLLGKEEGSHPSVFERLSGLFPRHSSAPPTNPPPEEKREQFDHALKVQIISWNMNDTLPKGDLAALLGVVPPYGSESSNPAASDFQLEDTGHPYHIIVIAGQECPTGLLPMGMGAVKMERSKENKHKTKSKEEDGSPNKPKKPRRSEEEELQPLTESLPTKDMPPSTPTVQASSLPLPGQIQHSSGWSALLEDWYSKGLGTKRFSLEDWQVPTSPVAAIPPSPAPSRSPSLPALPLPPTIPDPAKLTVPPSPRRMSTLVPGYSSNGHIASPAEQGPYVLVAKERLMGIYMAVYVHRETRSLVRGFSKSSVTAGLIGGRLGNKGGVGISLNIAGSSFLFVNAHLAAHEGRQAMRIENMEKIQAELKLDNFGEHLHPRKPIPNPAKTDITDAFDYTFIFGDLNFRLNVSRLHADWLISRQEYLRAQEFDELRANMRSNKIFSGFEEPQISFPPTFKYDVPKSRHHTRKYKEGREKSGKGVGMGGVRVSIRRSRKRRKSKGKIKGTTQEGDENSTADKGGDERVSGQQKLQPVNERETEVSSIGEDDSDVDRDQEEADSASAFSGIARPSGSTNRAPSTRSHRSGVLSTRSPFSEPDTEHHEEDGNDTAYEDGEEANLYHNTQLNAGNTPGRNAVLKIFTRNAKQSWRAIVAKSTSSLGAIPLPKSPTSPVFDSRPRAKSPTKSERFSPGIGLGFPEQRLRGVSSGPEITSGLNTPTVGVGMGRSQPNLVLDTGIAEPPENSRPRASVDGGSKSVTSALGITGAGSTLAPPAMIRASSSIGSVTGNSVNAPAEDSSDSENVRGVYDTSSKQRVPSWCDRIVYKSMVLSPQPPPSLPVPTFSAPLSDTLHEDGRFSRVGNIFTNIRHRGSRGQKDSLPQPTSRENTLSSPSRAGSLTNFKARAREVHLSEARASPFLQQPGDGDDSAIVIVHESSSRPDSSGKSGKRPGSSGKRPGSAGSTGTTSVDQPASLHWPRTNPFARLLHPHPHTPGGPGLIHAVSMEPQPQPSAEPSPMPRPRSFSTSEGREKTRDRAGSGPRTPRQSDGDVDNPVAQPPKDDGFWRFFKQFNREPTVIVAEPEPEPEPAEGLQIRRRGDIVCVSYGTLDDREMQRLGGRSDHRPVIGTYAVYI
ncbi:unnamed protein product [Rhizoctonia solani]|uniref:Inositol polyphosphate-related phosphatase domain-containing protein n=1 Tax=Rhizoctonia solani TaxID=456999 RepID=A0A8H3BFM7_9AGAM|nr:unnamed protein product [Rhizoctonia solani]